jgi:indole-3-glycerol phosphate synthase
VANILERIAAYKREEVAGAKAHVPLSALMDQARSAEPVRPFVRALENRIGQGDHALIAEIKKASPSKGLIRADFAPAVLARAYEAAGAACLSVLTDRPSFQGAPEFLTEARNATRLPVLRKDFMLDPYQVAEARVLGADCILLIMAMIDDVLARDLEAQAIALGMDVLCEVHDEQELNRAARLKTRLIGINNRDLRTFETRLETSERLAPLLPAGAIPVAESGLGSADDLKRLSRAGINAFLIGESLMRQRDVEAATRAILHKPGKPA